MSRIVVDLDQLQELVDRMGLFQSHLIRLLDTADAQVRQLHGSWTGAAAESHQALHARWRAAAADVQRVLSVLRGIASGAHANYAAAVAANRQMWSE